MQRAISIALLPLSFLYDVGGRIRRLVSSPLRTGLPVICIGNLTTGGTGKTPLTMAIAERLRAAGHNPHILTRGYGGALRGPVLVKPEIHIAADVGDEPLLLSRAAPTWVARRRALGALAAAAGGANVLLMDDGFQNSEIEKSVSILVVDGEVGFGNGFVLPAGPLRETTTTGFSRADALVVMGQQSARTLKQISQFPGPVFHARLEPVRAEQDGGKVLAFAGIGRPEKLFDSLAQAGSTPVLTRTFSDHHVYSEAEIDELRRLAAANGLLLVTTEKDWIRLPESQRHGIKPFPIKAVIAEDAAFSSFLGAQLAIYDHAVKGNGPTISFARGIMP